jgi:hypothetical protein
MTHRHEWTQTRECESMDQSYCNDGWMNDGMMARSAMSCICDGLLID